jgi:putative flippase GtrA
MSPQALKVCRYIVSGGTATAVNLLILFLLVHFAGVYYLLASIISFISSTVVSFTLQKFWTFGDRARERMHFQFALYAGITAVNIAVNTLLMYLFVTEFGIWYLASQVLSGLIIALMSYFTYQKFVFTTA